MSKIDIINDLYKNYEAVEIVRLSDQQFTFLSNSGDIWQPPERISVSDWAEKHYVHEEGKLRLIPFQRGLLDAFSDPSIEYISFKKSARVGATMSMVIGCVYFAAQDPQRLMMTQPTDDDCKGISTDHVQPAYDRCPQTQALFKSKLATRNTQTHKVFPGGSLKILAAKSPRNLRRHDVDVLMLDEVDGYETTVEGDPIKLAIRRTQNSPRRKIYMASTPVNAETSKICRAFEDSDKRHYYVPCPHCGSHQTLDWDRMCIDERFTVDMALEDLKDDTWIARMRCKDCDELIDESFKDQMLKQGEWVAHAPFRGNAGFFINTLYSPFTNASWQKLVVEYLEAKRSPDTLQTFQNTVLGLEWNSSIDDLDVETIKERKTDVSLHPVPHEVLLITVGVDVQKDRVEITHLGHKENGGILVLSHDKLYGDPTGEKLWDDLDDKLAEDFLHEDGGQIGIAAVAVDSGNWTQSVYKYCAGRQIKGIYAIKGVDGEKRQLWTESKIRPGMGAKLYNVSTDDGRKTILQRLAVNDLESPACIEFSDKLDDEYFKQLLSRYRKLEYVHNSPKFTWLVREGHRCESIDCFVYGYAVKETLSPNWKRLRESVQKPPHEDEKPKKTGFSGLGSQASSM